MESEMTTRRMLAKENSSLRISLSEQLNLVTIRGALYGKQYDYKLNDLIKSIKDHFLLASHLNIYIKLSQFDLDGIKKLLTLYPIINQAILEEKYISIYWNTMDNQEINKIASGFSKKLNCEVQLCNI